jgi:hypothetical protein
MGHTPVTKHLNIMGLFDGNPDCRFCKMAAETACHIICCCKTLAYQCYNFFGIFSVVPKDISMATLKGLCLFVFYVTVL